jgi:hypothetical protein
MDVPLQDPQPLDPADPGAYSSGSFEILSGDTALIVWTGCETLAEAGLKVQLQLEPDHPVVIGRAEGWAVPYLDPAYRPTRIVPGTGQSVVRSGNALPDNQVSRGHFTLRGDPRGIVLTNGVPRVGGGIRPPVNGTWLQDAGWRLMQPGEEYLIAHQATAVLALPNGTVVQISAA